jgi:hypothetical protein
LAAQSLNAQSAPSLFVPITYGFDSYAPSLRFGLLDPIQLLWTGAVGLKAKRADPRDDRRRRAVTVGKAGQGDRGDRRAFR